MPDPVADELAVRRTAAAYTDAVNRMDFAAAAATYAPDGVLSLLNRPLVEGRAAVQEMLEGYRDRYAIVVQTVHSGLVQIDGDLAHARWQVSEILLAPPGAPLQVMGRYEDELVRLEEGWRFAERVFVGRYLGDIDYSTELLADEPVRFTFPF